MFFRDGDGAMRKLGEITILLILCAFMGEEERTKDGVGIDGTTVEGAGMSRQTNAGRFTKKTSKAMMM